MALDGQKESQNRKFDSIKEQKKDKKMMEERLIPKRKVGLGERGNGERLIVFRG